MNFAAQSLRLCGSIPLSKNDLTTLDVFEIL